MERTLLGPKTGLFAIFIFGVVANSWAGGSLGNAGSFNAFIFDQATLQGGESEGAIAVGGLGLSSGQTALTTSGAYNTLIKSGTQATLGSLNNIGLYVNGNVSFQGGQLNNGGNGYVSGNVSTSNPYDLNGGGSFYYGGTLSGTIQGGTATHSNQVASSYFTQQQTYSQNEATGLDSVAANATLNTSDPNNFSLNYGGAVQNNKTYVVDVTAAQLANNVTLSLSDPLHGGTSLNSTDSLIFNVTGAVNNFGVSVNANGLQSRILWNFGTDSSVTINNRQLEGSVLAPDATVYQSTVIEGTLIAKNWDTYNGVEIHSFNYNGGDPAPTPEPAPFLALGIGAAGIFVRRKKK